MFYYREIGMWISCVNGMTVACLPSPRRVARHLRHVRAARAAYLKTLVARPRFPLDA